MNGEVKGLCTKCRFLNSGDPVTNCYENNSYKEFAKRHKVLVVVKECKDFKKQEAIIIEEEAQAEEAEVQQEVKEKGGV